ncbi:hypothetical protein RE0327_09660 [Prescottella equi]|nr:hypothetical protein RE0327_09660 [Prescottella equi]
MMTMNWAAAMTARPSQRRDAGGELWLDMFSPPNVFGSIDIFVDTLGGYRMSMIRSEPPAGTTGEARTAYAVSGGEA